MANLPANLIKEFVKMTDDSKPEKKQTQLQATVHVQADGTYVQIDGSDILTPVSNVVDAQNGDRVMVTIENHSATILGNYTYPPSQRDTIHAQETADEALEAANRAKASADAAQDAADILTGETREALDVAQAAQTTADKAVEDAAAAQGSANQALTDASTAKSQADKALADASTAQSTANTAVANATKAQSSADKAQEDANAAQSKAVEALQKAEDADDAAQAAQEVADQAVIDAATAQGSANEALTDAAEANSKAEVAKTTADQAVVDAADAKGLANAAQEDVNAVKEDVVELETGLNNANTAAQAAQTTADKAVEDAATAKQAADKAQEDADAANTALVAAQSTADSALEKANQAQGTADDAQASAASAQASIKIIQDDVAISQAEIAALATNLETVSTTMEADYARKTDVSETTAHLQSQITQNAAQIQSTVTKITEVDETVGQAAADAQAAAEEAQRLAGLAQAQADTATADAAKAQTAADNAKEAADKAQEDANAANQAAADADAKAVQAAADLAEAEQNLADVTSRVDSTEEEIEAAQQAVSNAQAAADKANTDAANAAQAAADAQSTANTAVTNAANAQTAADQAATNASAAQSTANQAVQDAATAQQTANEAKTAAGNAQSTANQAVQDAAAAQSTANTAVSNAATAKQAADAAKKAADDAQDAADDAAADAQAAQTIANQAVTDAANAQKAADDAQDAADAADIKLAQAQLDLAAAQQDLVDITAQVDATEEEIEAAKSAVATAQAAADKAQEDANAANQAADDAAKDAAAAQSTANTAVSNAANAQTKANQAATAASAAQSTADKAQEDAEAAQSTADSAVAAANTAQEAADKAIADALAAQNTANSAASAASAAQSTADTAKANAATAQSKAEQAASAAATATGLANAAQSKADQAAADLAEAEQNLETVKGRVDATEEEIEAAQQAVTEAKAAADAAQDDADAAWDRAGEAISNAADAQTAADNAKKAADDAQDDADAAKRAADAAQDAADALAIRMTTAETNITQNAELIALAATKTEVATTLGGYYTKSQADAAIQVSANGILNTVSNNYQTISGMGDYSTTTQMNTAINQKANEITLTVSENYEKVTSKGEQLIVNGNCMMGDDTNFSAWTFDGAVANNSPGSFTYPSGKKATLVSDEYFLINPSLEYTFQFDMKSANGLMRMYSMINFYDIDKKEIKASNHMYHPGSTTTLAQDLKSGDTVIYLTDASGWSTTVSYGFYLAIWNYTNSHGYTYPSESYTRNRVTLPKTSNNTLDSSKINYTANTITLTTAYSGSTIPAGTSVSQGRDGGNYKYTPLSNTLIPTTWTSYTGKYSGTDYSGTNINTKFPPGTAYAKLAFLWNYNTAADQAWITNISVYDATMLSTAKSYTDTQIQIANNAISLKVSSSDFNSYKTTVTNDINSAKSSAISTASTDATNKANAAKEAAISTASTDATNKANAALNDAKAYTDTEVADLDERLDAAELKITDAAIIATVSSTYVTKDAAGNTYATKTALSTLSQTVDSIEARVEDAEGNISRVEQTASGILSTVSSTYATKAALAATEEKAVTALSNVSEFIAGTQTAATGSWTGVSETITSLYDGLQITYWLPVAGSGNATLNLTLANGTTTGAKNVYYRGTTRATTHFSAGSAVRLTYRTSVTIGTSTYTGWWADASYDSGNYYDRTRIPNAIKLADSGTAYPYIMVGTSAGYKIAKSGVTFDISYPVLVYNTSTDAVSGNTTTYMYSALGGVTLRNNVSGWTGTQYAMVYLVGTLSGKTFTIDSSVFTTTVPTSDNGKVYIPIGTAYSTYQITFKSDPTIYGYGPNGFGPISMNAQTRIEQIDEKILLQASSIAGLEEDVTTLEVTASGLTNTVSSHTGSISTLQQTATGFETRITTAQSTADEASKVANAGAKKINTHMRNFTCANWQNYGVSGHSENWTTGTNYDNTHIKVGDVAYIAGTVSDAGGSNTVSAMIYGTVTAVTTSHVTMTSLYYIMGGEGGAYALANSANTAATNAAKTATNFMSYDSTNGLLIGNKSSGSWSGNRAQITSSAFNILNSSGTALAQFGSTVTIGQASAKNVYIDSNNINIRNGSTVLAQFGTNTTIGQTTGRHVYINPNSGVSIYNNETLNSYFGDDEIYIGRHSKDVSIVFGDYLAWIMTDEWYDDSGVSHMSTSFSTDDDMRINANNITLYTSDYDDEYTIINRTAEVRTGINWEEYSSDPNFAMVELEAYEKGIGSGTLRIRPTNFSLNMAPSNNASFEMYYSTSGLYQASVTNGEAQGQGTIGLSDDFFLIQLVSYADSSSLAKYYFRNDGLYHDTDLIMGKYGNAKYANELYTPRRIKVNLGSGDSTGTLFSGAADITLGVYGTLAVARGGTGITSNPSMLVNLGSTSAASVFAASPRPGVTGTLGVANGGTGASTAAAARDNLDVWMYDLVSNTSYPGLAQPNGATTGYVRTPQSGMIPYQSGGHGTVGTSSWPFNNGYFKNLYAQTALSVTGDITTTGDVILNPSKYIRCKNAAGTAVTSLGINSNDNLLVGYGMPGVGDTHVYGNDIYFHPETGLYSTGSITFDNGRGIKSYTADGSVASSLLYVSSNNNVCIGDTDDHNNMYLYTKNFTLRLCPPDSGSSIDGYFYPVTDSKVACGTSSHKWYRLYAASATVLTSDRRQKENIKALKNVRKTRKKSNGNTEEYDVYSELFDRLEAMEYNFIEGEKRKNFGLIAQDLLEVMKELGIEEDELDLVHHDQYIDEETGEEKHVYGIAYENLIALLINEVQKLKAQRN